MIHHEITFSRKEDTVYCNIDTDLPYDEVSKGSTFNFKWKCESCYAAELLLRYLTTRHEDAIELIRRKEFESGWKQAKAKKFGKSTACFYSTFYPGASHE